jgi:hypothetical protein
MVTAAISHGRLSASVTAAAAVFLLLLLLPQPTAAAVPLQKIPTALKITFEKDAYDYWETVHATIELRIIVSPPGVRAKASNRTLTVTYTTVKGNSGEICTLHRNFTTDKLGKVHLSYTLIPWHEALYAEFRSNDVRLENATAYAMPPVRRNTLLAGFHNLLWLLFALALATLALTGFRKMLLPPA